MLTSQSKIGRVSSWENLNFTNDVNPIQEVKNMKAMTEKFMSKKKTRIYLGIILPLFSFIRGKRYELDYVIAKQFKQSITNLADHPEQEPEAKLSRLNEFVKECESELNGQNSFFTPIFNQVKKSYLNMLLCQQQRQKQIEAAYRAEGNRIRAEIENNQNKWQGVADNAKNKLKNEAQSITDKAAGAVGAVKVFGGKVGNRMQALADKTKQLVDSSLSVLRSNFPNDQSIQPPPSPLTNDDHKEIKEQEKSEESSDNRQFYEQKKVDPQKVAAEDKTDKKPNPWMDNMRETMNQLRESGEIARLKFPNDQSIQSPPSPLTNDDHKEIKEQEKSEESSDNRQFYEQKKVDPQKGSAGDKIDKALFRNNLKKKAREIKVRK